MASIELKNLSKSFNTELVVDKISISVADGEFLVLVGPSGCGKSTLLRMIAGLEKVTEGDIFFSGEHSTDRPPRDRDIAMVFQNYALYPHMTVGQNLGFALKVRNIPKEEIANRVKKIATTLKLETLLDRKPRELSGGQRQRVAMGRAMIREPAVYLMDEPLSNLDTKLRVAMRTALLRLRDQLRVTTVYVTHDQLEALTLGDRVAVMRDGVLQQIDTPHTIFHRPSNVFVAGFIGSPSINLVEAKVADGFASFGQFKIPVGTEWNLQGRTSVILGLRPSDFERVESENENLVVFSVEVEVVEDLGTEINLLFSVKSPRVESDKFGSSAVSGEGDVGLLGVNAGECLFTVVLDSGTPIKSKQTMKLAIDPNRIYLFDSQTGLAIENSSTEAQA